MSDETPQDDLPTETSSVETGVTEAEDQAADAGKNAELNREAVEDSVDSLSARIEEISARIDSLLPGVLETAEAANGAADVNREASVNLKKGLGQIQARVDSLNSASEKSALLASRVMIGAVSSLVIAVFVYGFIAFQLAGRVTQVDSMLVAVSKRIVQMNSALTTFEQLRFSIEQLAGRQAQFAERQMLLVEAVSRSEVSARSMATELPGLAAQQVGEKTDQVVAQVANLGKDLEGQAAVVDKLSKAVGALGTQMKSLEGRVSNVQKLNADVEALITLERENYLEVLSRQVALEEARQAEDAPPAQEPPPSIVVYPIISGSR
jgi:DNA repair exonuclease SbcCD ATPase subunit